MTPEPQRWEGCYDQQWAGVITPESMAHPAKFSRGLIERIYRHCLERGYLKRNEVVGDCFGGVGTGGVMAAYAGLRWIGCELEPRFCAMAKANFELHRAHLELMGLPLPEILQGDSRQFDKLVGQACGIVSSPPFVDSLQKGCKPGDNLIFGNARYGHKDRHTESISDYGTSPGQIGALPSGNVAGVISSPPYISGGHHPDQTGSYGGLATIKGLGTKDMAGYGQTGGQIGQLPPGDLAGVISSPPYSDIAAGQGGLNTKPAKKPGQQTGRTASLPSQNADQRYGHTEGQISQLKSGDLAAVVSSPPWVDNVEGGIKAHKVKFVPDNGKGHPASLEARAARLQRDEQKVYGDSPGQIGKLKGGELQAVVSSPPYNKPFSQDHPGTRGGGRANGTAPSSVPGAFVTYGQSEGQIEGVKPETYWQAVRDVYAACWRAIKPGGVIVLVVKSYVKQRKVVDLPSDTLTLLVSLGFEPLERIQAMLKTTTVHNDLFEGTVTKVKSRASFFRRLAEKKGSPPIDFEEVLICRKPNDSEPYAPTAGSP